MARDVTATTTLEIHEAPAWCGWCGNETPGAYLPCAWCQSELKKRGVTPDHECAGDGQCGDYPAYENGAPGEPRHEPTWCEGATLGLRSTLGPCATDHATVWVGVVGAESGVTVCSAHKGWALTDGAVARAEEKI